MDYIELIKLIIFKDLNDADVKNEIIMAIDNFQTASFELQLDNDTFFAIKKVLVYLGKKYGIDLKDTEYITRTLNTLDDIVVSLQIPLIDFRSQDINDKFFYETAYQVYRDFRTMLLNKDKFFIKNKRYVRNYIYYISRLMQQQIQIQGLNEDAEVYQFNELLRLLTISFKKKTEPIIRPDVLEIYMDNRKVLQKKLVDLEENKQ